MKRKIGRFNGCDIVLELTTRHKFKNVDEYKINYAEKKIVAMLRSQGGIGYAITGGMDEYLGIKEIVFKGGNLKGFKK